MDEKPKTSIISSTYTDLEVPTVPIDQVRQEIEDTIDLASRSQAETTRINYASTWRAFEPWCSARSIDSKAATPEIVATYLQTMLKAGANPRSVVRAYSALAARLREIQADGDAIWPRRQRPTIIQNVLKAGAREYAQPRIGKKPLLPAHFEALAAPERFDRTRWLKSARNRALLLLGFGGGFRRSELVSLDARDLELREEGVIVRIRKSKTDLDAVSAVVGVWRQEDTSKCPVAALETYLRGARITEGPVFRALHLGKLTERRMCDDMVALIVKEAVASIGLDPKLYAGHSLRTGFVTAAYARGSSIEEIMNTTRHRSFEQVKGYIRRESPFDRNASRGLLEPLKK